MAITQDVGEANDIHPTDRLPAAKRLALAARKVAYGQNILAAFLASGPIFRQATREGKALRLWFDYSGDGLRTAGAGAIEGLRIAGKNGQFKPAEAKIEADSILVSNSEVGYPVSVRYAWGGTVVGNLVNSIAIPASPFRVSVQ